MEIVYTQRSKNIFLKKRTKKRSEKYTWSVEFVFLRNVRRANLCWLSLLVVNLSSIVVKFIRFPTFAYFRIVTPVRFLAAKSHPREVFGC